MSNHTPNKRTRKQLQSKGNGRNTSRQQDRKKADEAMMNRSGAQGG